MRTWKKAATVAAMGTTLAALPTMAATAAPLAAIASPIAPYGGIGAEWNAKGGAAGFLGQPQDNEYDVAGVPGARMEDFQGGQIYWSGPTGAHEVHGLIAIKYRTGAGGPTTYGLPLTDEVTTPDGIGRFNHFQGGSIYWTPSTGAHTVYGGIKAEWAATGWEQGILGYPTSDENNALAPGRYNDFQRGVIYWSPTTGAHEVHGAILGAWAGLGYERSGLGFPTTDEVYIPNGGDQGQSNFEGGYINWINGEITVHVDQHN
jgi:uncharacterized protein with LGFP repeats